MATSKGKRSSKHAKSKSRPVKTGAKRSTVRAANRRGVAASHADDAEGGPRDRARQFTAERTNPILPKDRPSEVRSTSAHPNRDIEQTGEAGETPGGDTDAAKHRRDVLREYRQRLQSEAASRTRAMADPQAPMPPLPPPANNWIPIGPSVLRRGQGGVQPATSGRVPDIAVAPGGSRVYIGAANGGVWRSDDAGRSWRSLMDAFDLNPTAPASDSLAIGALAIDPANPDRVYVGSGEGTGTAYYGVGPIVTSNGTSNAPAWVTESVAPGSTALIGQGFYALAVDPANPERVVGASTVGVYRREPSGAGAFHWSQKTLGAITSQVASSVVVASTGGVTTFYAAIWNGLVYRSSDGHTWNALGAGFPALAGRVSLAVQRDNPRVLYALVQNGMVYRLDIVDGTWRRVAGEPVGFTGTQGWYDLAIAVSPDNVNRIFLGGSTLVSAGEWSGSLFRCDITVNPAGVSMAPTYIGGSIHADVHRITFAPSDATKLWVGCDGGVFYSTNPTGSGNIFESRNAGLQTLTMEHLSQHPTEDAVLFAGTQDNGAERFTGEEAWLYSADGDCGYTLVNWNDPYRVLATYVYGSIRRSTDGGKRRSYSNVNVPLAQGEPVLFYAPLAGTPPNIGSANAAAEADLVAFGSIRPWISTGFGGSWQSIPSNTLAGDSLAGPIRSLAFASPNRFYAGTYVGWLFVSGSWVQYTDAAVYRFDRGPTGWSRTRIDTLVGANTLPIDSSITDIAVDPGNPDRIFVSIGGFGDYRHIWHFDGTRWEPRSGPAPANPNSLLDVQINAVAVDPSNTGHLYAGADIGVWRSVDSGINWAPYSDGLPDAAVMDLLIHDPRRLIRAATHGRGVYERALPDAPKKGVELYVRSTQLDQGRGVAVNGSPDPTEPGQTVRFWRGPDIKLDTPDATGQYQFPPASDIDFLQFTDALSDDFQNVATHATASIVTRAYVQVHNRGVTPANSVRVMLLLANASVALPALPAGFDVNVRNGLPINTGGWQTIGIVTLDDVRVGFPKIAAFNISSSMLPTPTNLGGNQHHCVLALLHHAADPFTNIETNTDVLSGGDRKAAHKNLTVVQFIGTPPPVAPLVVPVRLHNAGINKLMRSNLVLNAADYPGSVGLLVPPFKSQEELRKDGAGLAIGKTPARFLRWADWHLQAIRANQRRRRRYHDGWARQRTVDLRLAIDKGVYLDVANRSCAVLRNIPINGDEYHTVFLVFERPTRARLGEAYDLDLRQLNSETEAVLGGLDLRIEIVAAPRTG